MGKEFLYLYFTKPLSALCCVKKLNSNMCRDFLLLKHIKKSLKLEMDE